MSAGLAVGAILTIAQVHQHSHASGGAASASPGAVFRSGASFAFVISPCCTPVLIGILAYCAQNLIERWLQRRTSITLCARPCGAGRRTCRRRRVDIRWVTPLQCRRSATCGEAGTAYACTLWLFSVPRVNAIPVCRRLVIAVTSSLIAAVLFHGQVAMALVTRGDDFWHAAMFPWRGILPTRRADGSNSQTAVDRYVFFGMQQRSKGGLMNDSIQVATAYSSCPSARWADLCGPRLVLSSAQALCRSRLRFCKGRRPTAQREIFYFRRLGPLPRR